MTDTPRIIGLPDGARVQKINPAKVVQVGVNEYHEAPADVTVYLQGWLMALPLYVNEDGEWEVDRRSE